MNCKPGDLAVVVNGGQWHQEHVGKIVSVKRLAWPNEYGPTWEYEPELWSTKWQLYVPCLEDVAIRPIRDPGDDAVDESKAWLPPVPAKTRETA